jgi:hypothetical protein
VSALRRYQKAPEGWSTPLRTLEKFHHHPGVELDKTILRQQMAEFTGALDFLLHWKQQTANLLQAAEDDVGILARRPPDARHRRCV